MPNFPMQLALSLGTSLLAMAAPASAQDQLKVVASFSILGDMAAQIGGDHIELTTLVGPNGDAHVFEPSAADARTVAEADVLLVNGLGFEGWLPRLVEAAEFKGTQVEAAAGITPRANTQEEDHDHGGDEHEHEHEGHDHGSNDPHAWQDLANGVIYANNIAAGFAAADPDNAEVYHANAEAYVAQLQGLDARTKSEIATIPQEQRRVVTSHDAFGYFQAAYGIEFVAPEGVSTESEATAADVAAIIAQIRAEGINAVFVENVTDTRLVDQISSEADVSVGGALFSDALSDGTGPAPTYLAMFEHNVEAIVSALKAD